MAPRLSPHFTLDEFVFSQTAARKGIDNTPTQDIIDNLERVAAVMEEVRDLLGVSVRISSGYRSPRLNKAIKGSKTSRHMLGLAADFTAPEFGTPKDVALTIAASAIEFDQLIYEYGRWVHLGLEIDGETPRLQTLSKFDAPEYLVGIVDDPLAADPGVDPAD